MDKLKMQSENLVNENIEKIAKLFPNCVTEGKNEKGQVVKLVDFDLLKQELSNIVVEGNDERYTLNWAGKKQAMLTANSPINATLRPCKEESVDFENTKNIYIEGDNLDVLKLLRETYLNKVKMIYIDPPYNTGNDFVYEDDFATSSEDYLQASKSYDEQGNRMFVNNDSNGRFHSDWLSMLFSRLKLVRDLLKEEGLIFISIDENEQSNLIKICDEVFGEKNFVAEFVWKCRNSLQHDEPLVSKQTERIVLYVKDKSLWNSENLKLNRIRKPFDATEYKNPDNDPRGPWLSSGKTRNDGRPSYTVVSPAGVSFTKPWIPSPAEFKRWEEENLIWWGKDGKSIPRKKAFLKDFKGNAISDILLDEYTDEVKGENDIKRTKRWEIGTTEVGTKQEKELFCGVAPFDYPKPVSLIKYLITIATSENDVILDFFSGSSTTAHAVMQLNAEDGGNRKFIMVQLPEKCEETSEAYKAGYKNICEIGKERIRRAGKKIKEENPNVTNLDIGFRVLKLDSSCMKDTYYTPNKYVNEFLKGTNFLDELEDNIKEDRTPEDLLFQVMLDMGVMLSSEIKTLNIEGKKVFNVNDGNLVCCFDKHLTNEVVKQIAKMQPLYAVFRDNSMATDSVNVNFDQIFETYSPTTTRKVL